MALLSRTLVGCPDLDWFMFTETPDTPPLCPACRKPMQTVTVRADEQGRKEYSVDGLTWFSAQFNIF